MSASYQIKLHYADRDNMVQVEAGTVGMAILQAANGKPKPDNVSAKVLLRRPGTEAWISCYVSPAILDLL